MGLDQTFVYRGVDNYFFQEVASYDYPLMMIMTTVIRILVTELTYGRIDPRAKEGGSDHESY